MNIFDWILALHVKVSIMLPIENVEINILNYLSSRQSKI